MYSTTPHPPTVNIHWEHLAPQLYLLKLVQTVHHFPAAKMSLRLLTQATLALNSVALLAGGGQYVSGCLEVGTGGAGEA